MEKDIYRQLQERLDGYAIGFPSTRSGVEIQILKKLFKDKEAALFPGAPASPFRQQWPGLTEAAPFQ